MDDSLDVFKRDIVFVNIPAGVPMMRDVKRRKRLRKKLAKRHNIRHVRDLSKLTVHKLTGAYPIAWTCWGDTEEVICQK